MTTGHRLFCQEVLCFNTTPCRHMPLLVHFRSTYTYTYTYISLSLYIYIYIYIYHYQHALSTCALRNREVGGARLEPHRFFVAQANISRASIYLYMRGKQGGTVSSNSRFQTVQFQQYSANLSVYPKRTSMAEPPIRGHRALGRGAKQLVLVGDHCQLGPVIMCKKAAKASRAAEPRLEKHRRAYGKLVYLSLSLYIYIYLSISIYIYIYIYR